MLKLEKNRYFVYPSWAELSYSWEELPTLLTAPQDTRYFRENPNRRNTNWPSFGFPAAIQPFEVFNGPVGGGIVRAHVTLDEKWLPALILCEEANLVGAAGMMGLLDRWNPGVSYLEPLNEVGWQLGLGRKKKLYLCSASVEHAESAHDKRFWIVGFKKGKKEIPGLTDIPLWAMKFGLSVSRLERVPECFGRKRPPGS